MPTVKCFRSGGSLVVSIPKEFAGKLRIQRGTVLQVELNGGRIVYARRPG